MITPMKDRFWPASGSYKEDLKTVPNALAVEWAQRYRGDASGARLVSTSRAYNLAGAAYWQSIADAQARASV